MRASIGALAAAVVVVACESPAGGPGLSIDAFPAEIARANCELLFSCCATAADASAFTPGASLTSEADCRAYFEMYFRGNATALAPYVDAGRVVWDASAAGACVASVDAASCADLPWAVASPSFGSPLGDASCRRTAVGTAPLGTTCWTALDCASGYCPDAPVRVCAAPPAAGEPCIDVCVEPLYCDASLTTPTCVTPAPNGASCTPGFDGTCESRYCASGVCADGPALPYCTGAP